MVPHEKTQDWISAQLADLTEQGPIVRYELWHTAVDDVGEKLETFAIHSENMPDATELGQHIFDVAETDALSRTPGSRQRYTLQAYRHDAGDPDASHPFVITATLNSSLSGNSEPANEKGLLGQMMRQNSDMHRLCAQLSESTAGRLSTDLNRARDENARLRENQLKHMEVMQDLADRQHERNIERAQHESSAKRMDDLMQFGLQMAPLIIAKIAAVSAPNSADAAIGISTTKFLMNLPMDNFKTMIAGMGPKDQLTFMELYQTVRDKATKDDEKRPPEFRDYTKTEDIDGDVGFNIQ